MMRLARQLYALRRRRANYFDCTFFSEPAWDILLDLYIAHRDGRKVCITSACIAAAAPATTALRWVRHLEDEELVMRETDPDDGRRAYVRLSPAGITRMECLLRDGLRIFAPQS